MAINNLYFDPSRQRARNAQYIQDAQDAHAQGHLSILREWSLVGTGVRELIVPDLDAAAEAEATRFKANDPSAELFEDDNSPAAELAHLPLPILPIPGRPTDQLELNPSSLFTDNQLINSWIKRHQRDNPMSMTGDPILRLNASQTKAVAMAMGERLSLIQGVSVLLPLRSASTHFPPSLARSLPEPANHKLSSPSLRCSSSTSASRNRSSSPPPPTSQ